MRCFVWWCPVLLLLLVGCSNSTVTTIVGPAGGKIDGPGGMNIEIPAGALSSDVVFTITEASQPTDSSFTAMGTTYEIGPAGTTFSQRVTLTLPYDSKLLPSIKSEQDIKIYTSSSGDDGSWSELASNASDGMVTAEILHLSFFVPGVEAEVLDSGTPNGDSAPISDGDVTPPADASSKDGGVAQDAQINPTADATPTSEAGTCGAGLIDCGGFCVDTETDPHNCGFCGIQCPSGEVCVGSVCQQP
ncbi:MAG: hypothetical protein V1754_09060 [Pseudomonadota bacterium]